MLSVQGWPSPSDQRVLMARTKSSITVGEASPHPEISQSHRGDKFLCCD